MKNYQTLARAIGSRLRCIAANNQEWIEKWEKVITEVQEELPQGSGFDNGSNVDLDESTGDEIVINTAYHHMNENGMYDGWTEHRVIVTPSLELEFRLKITGRDRNQIKEYIAESFQSVLSESTVVPEEITV